MRLVLSAIIFGIVLTLACIDWSGKKAGALNVLGSTSIQPFAEMLSQEFNKGRTDFVVDVQGGGSTAGIQAAKEGIADIGMCSRKLKDDEAALFTPVTIARDGLAIVVPLSNPIGGLTKNQIRQIFSGEIDNWKTLGGPDRPIRPITREEGSGTREAFQKLVMDKSRISRKALTQESNGAVKELVKHDPCAIGYMSLGLVGSDLKALEVDGAVPTTEAVVTNKYPLVRPFLFVTKGPPGERAKQFIEYVLSADSQRMLEKEGLVRVK